MHAATLVIDVGSADPEAVAGALSVEAAGGLPRVTASVAIAGDGRLEVEVSAEDVASLRAAVNSFLRWAHMATRVSSGASINLNKSRGA